MTLQPSTTAAPRCPLLLPNTVCGCKGCSPAIQLLLMADESCLRRSLDMLQAVTNFSTSLYETDSIHLSGGEAASASPDTTVAARVTSAGSTSGFES